MFYKYKIRGKILYVAFYSILAIYLFSGCQKIITVDLNVADPVIVIEGLITDKPGPYSVTISKTGSYFDQPVLPPVSGAEVTISDNIGTIDILLETSPGIYLTTKTRGVPGRTYTLKVKYEGKEYTGSSTMHSQVRIDSLNLTKSQSIFIGIGGGGREDMDIDLNCYFKDPPEKNYYRLKVFTNDTAWAENYRLFDDQYTNGQEVGLRAARAKAGSTYRIDLFSLDRQTYTFYRTLEDLLYNNPFFGSTPANPNTNLSNGALGYFGASATSSKTITLTNISLKTIK